MRAETTNPHGWFFQYIKMIGDEDTDEARKALVYDYSDGKTESLKELFEKYPSKYRKMRAKLSACQKMRAKSSVYQQGQIDDDRLDKARKKLIAAIFANLEGRGGAKPTMGYVKAVACQGAKVKRFNDITLSSLKNLYNIFRNKDLQASVNELLKTTDL